MNDVVHNTKGIDKPSVLVTLLVVCRFIISWLANFAGVSSSGLYVMGCIWVLYLFFSYKGNYINLKRVQASSFGFIILVLIMLLFSNLNSSGHVRDLTVEFFQYCLIGFLIGRMKFNIGKVCKYICYCLLIFSIPIFQIINNDLTQRWQQSITMDHSYFLLPICICVITHLIYYREESNILIKISYVEAIVVLGSLLLTGTRGAVLSIIVYVLLCYINSNRGASSSILKRVVLILLAIVSILFFSDLLNLLSIAFKGVGINLEFIDRTIQYIQSGDVSNGRTDIYHRAFSGFLHSPIFGNGIGSFAEHYPQYGYPHNMILQFMYEGGIVLTLPIIFIVIKGIKVLFVDIRGNKQEKITQTVFFTTSIIPAMLTNEPWAYPLLWCYFGIVLTGVYRDY